MNEKRFTYKHYTIEWISWYNEYDKWWNEGWGIFIGTHPCFSSTTFPTVSRAKVAIDLWGKFHMNVKKFWRYANHLFITNRFNYSGCYGKFKTIKELREIAKS